MPKNKSILKVNMVKVEKKPNHHATKVVIARIRVIDFYDTYAQQCQLKLIAGEKGLERILKESAVNRLGLALTGFYKHFAKERVQIVGKSEYSYMLSLPKQLLRQRIREIFTRKIPCVIFSHKLTPLPIVVEEAEKYKIPVFSSPMKTERLLNTVTLSLTSAFAPSSSEHGCMVDIQGIGVLIKGDSGIGKSECVLGLIERGYSLVSDDITKFRYVDGWELRGFSSQLTRNYMEVRGIGIINIASIFGASSIRPQKRLDLVVTLKEWHHVENIDRIGLDQHFYEVLNVKIPHITIPVRAGRDVAGLVEVAALNQKLKMMGQDSAVEFSEKLLSKLKTEQK